MPRHLKIGLIVLAVGMAISMGFFVDVVGRVRSFVNEKETEDNPFAAPKAPLYKPTDPPMSAKIFFPAPAGAALLSTEEKTIFQSKELINRAKQILQKLQDGPQSPSMTAPLPKDTKVQDIFLSEDGTAFIDFTNAISVNHPGGVLNELATVYSVVNSLTYNLPEIKQVKILIGGVEKETLAGHCLLLLPMQMDLSITDLEPPAQNSAVLK